MSKLVTRFAPSPTGDLHLGHAYAALVARTQGDTCLLRFEDIDRTRVRHQFYQHIEEDLSWLEIEFDQDPVYQLDRLEVYSDALESLKALNTVYPCFCTRKTLQTIDAPQGTTPVYSGACRTLERPQLEQPHCWRLNAVKASELTGPLEFSSDGQTFPVDPLLLGDVVLARKDVATSYHIAVTVDDAWQGVNLVTRGRDLLESTHVHRLLQKLLGLPEPRYIHHALIKSETGVRLAKRDKAKSLRQLKTAGWTAQDVRDHLSEVTEGSQL